MKPDPYEPLTEPGLRPSRRFQSFESAVGLGASMLLGAFLGSHLYIGSSHGPTDGFIPVVKGVVVGTIAGGLIFALATVAGELIYTLATIKRRV